MKSVVRLVWGCLSGRMYFMWRLSVCWCKGKCQMSVNVYSVYVSYIVFLILFITSKQILSRFIFTALWSNREISIYEVRSEVSTF